MKIVLVLIFIVAMFDGCSTAMQAKSAIHQILAYISYLIGAVCLCGAGILEAIDNVKKSVRSLEISSEKKITDLESQNNNIVNALIEIQKHSEKSSNNLETFVSALRKRTG